ncbi:hypothetical protein [Corynebacterium frankenforstense]|uniref:hypothetical protein n=1 Tax=Corynebacterium frankenforstense TaxID=1230998 RepID=UPI000A49D31E|nr:hypothetical protein [Corynebacterium frankenforstense]
MNVFKKTLVAAVASAFVVSGAGMAATPVLAQTEGTQDAAAAAATVDSTRTGSLTIHKKSSDTTGVANDGLEKTGASRAPTSRAPCSRSSVSATST